MANEFTITALLAYEDSEDTVVPDFGLEEFQKSITTKKYQRGKISVATAEQALDLGVLAALGWAVFINRDATNFVEIRSATGAANDIIKVPPLSAVLFHFGSNVTAPYIIADTAACQVEYLIFAP